MKISLLTVLVCFSSLVFAQTPIELTSSYSKLSCGSEFNYFGKIRINADTLTLFQLSNGNEEMANQYLIIEKESKWKIDNHHNGSATYKVLQLSDGTRKTISLYLKRGYGTLKFLGNGICEITLTVEVTTEKRHDFLVKN